jgi:hypothetical protein
VPAADLMLAWETFSEAADQAGISRRYGGIHFRQGDLDADASTAGWPGRRRRNTGRVVAAVVARNVVRIRQG